LTSASYIILPVTLSQGFVSFVTSQTNADTSGSGLDGTGLAARFGLIGGMVFHPVTDNLYVTDEGSHTIRMVTPEGKVTTVAGTGALGKPPTSSTPAVATSVLLNAPTGIAYNHRTNKFYFSDTGNRMVRVFDPVSGTIVRLAGSGSKTGNEGTMTVQPSPPSASFQMPGQLAYFSDPTFGDTVFVLDCLDVDYEPDYPNSDYASPTKVPDQLRRIRVDSNYVDIAAYQTLDDLQMPFSFSRTASGITVDPSSKTEAVVFFSDQCVHLEVLFPCAVGAGVHCGRLVLTGFAAERPRHATP
jgi:DNA-binding beta-propeller fold protein YncE